MMGALLLCSGGLDSTTVGYWLVEKRISFQPVFFDYGQHCVEKEWETVQNVLPISDLVSPVLRIDISSIYQHSTSRLIAETANRFARDLMVQEVGYAMLRGLGVTLVAADSPSSFLDDSATSNLIRQILGAVSEFDKAMTVAKLKGARDRVRRAQGKCEGRKAYAERKGGHELVALARQLRGNLDGQPQPLRKIAADLAERGCVTPSGRPYSASAIASMLGEG
jgi:DNA invertase Pin-like site-specific DNA recombinase